MAATVSIAESNGAGETVTASITNSKMGSTDAVNLDNTAYPIVPTENSYEKWQRLNVTNMGGSTSISAIKVWRTGSLTGSDAHVTNARETTYGGAETYATPVATASSVATQTMPSSEPTGANLGIGGSLSGSLTATGYSDYLVHQLQIDTATTTGATGTMNFKYTEIA